jgi:lipopolysaccharide heptosyltransferase I
VQLLIVKLSSIGDVVHTLPAAAVLRRSLPDARISWVVERRAAAILKDSPVIDNLIEIDSTTWRKRVLQPGTAAEVRAALRTLRTRPDVALDFQGLIKSGLISWLSKARRRVGFETAELREPASRLFLTRQVRTSGFSHVIEKNIALARESVRELTGVTPATADFDFPITLSDGDRRFASERAREIGGRFAIINPGGGWPTKRWPASEYSRLAALLLRRHSLPSFITHGPGEESLASEIAALTDGKSAIPLPSTIREFVALAQRASVFIGGDTGPLHLAAASGTPIVGIYGPTSSRRNGPFHPRDITIERDLWCRPNCHRRSCWHWECLAVSVEAVADAVAERLNDGQSVSSADRP